jgi:hypothetical protein
MSNESDFERLSEVQTPLEQAQNKFEAAMATLFFAYGPNAEDRNIKSLSDKPQLVEQTLFDLFDAGAEIKRLEAEEKLKLVEPFSDEALQIQKEADRYVIAADYIKGHRTQEKSRQAAVRVYDEYRFQAVHMVNEYLSMKEGTVKRTGFLHLKRDPAQQSAQRREETSYYRQIDFADDYIRRQYNLGYIPSKRDEGKTMNNCKNQQSTTLGVIAAENLYLRYKMHQATL